MIWIVKDFALYPWLRSAYEDREHDPGEHLVGRVGEVREQLDPSGYVRLGPELWRAELGPGCEPVGAGSSVRVLAVRGLTLIVEPC